MNEISRVTRSKTQARKNYNRLSRWYDFLAGSSEEKYRQMGVQTLSILPGEKVLEIGFGTGTSLVSLADLVGASGVIHGIDLSGGMAVVAQNRARKAGIGGRLALSLGDGAWLPYRDGYFDAVFISFTLELFDTPEIPHVLSECRRVLVEGGRLVVVALQKTTPPSTAERVYEWCHSRMPVLVDCRPIDLIAAVQQGGFSVSKTIAETMWGLPVSIVSAVISVV